MGRPAIGRVMEYEGLTRTSYRLKFTAYGRRHMVTCPPEVTSRAEAELELQNILADVRRGRWQPKRVVAPEPPPETPGFHRFASDWAARRGQEVDKRTGDYYLWALQSHLLPHFARYDVAAITVALVESYKTSKLNERNLWEKTKPEDRKRLGLHRPLSNNVINKTLQVLAQILDDAVDHELIASNPARGRKRRLKASKPRRTWLELDELRALLDATGDKRAMIATMALAGLRVGELLALRWADVDLARGMLKITDSKTDAGIRQVDVSPDLLDLLKHHRADATNISDRALVFPTSRGTEWNRSNLIRSVLKPAVAKANEQLVGQGLPPISSRVTNHTLRRTFASLLYEAGATPPYVMSQMGHTSADLALEMYAKKMQRSRDTGARIDALVRGEELSPTMSA